MDSSNFTSYKRLYLYNLLVKIEHLLPTILSSIYPIQRNTKEEWKNQNEIGSIRFNNHYTVKFKSRYNCMTDRSIQRENSILFDRTKKIIFYQFSI